MFVFRWGDGLITFPLLLSLRSTPPFNIIPCSLPTCTPDLFSHFLCTSRMSNWWDDLEPWAERAEDGDYRGIATYTVDATIKANHNILAGIRNNDFDVNDPSYCEL